MKTESAIAWSDAHLAVIPGSKLPSFIQTVSWLYDPVKYVLDCRRKFGKTFYIDFIGWGRVIMTSDPDLVHDAFTNKQGNFSVAQANSILEPVVGKFSTFVREGESHKVARDQMRGPLSPATIQRNLNSLFEISQFYADKLEHNPNNLRVILRNYCMSAMLNACFGRYDERTTEHACRLIKPVLGVLPSLLTFVPALHQDRGPFSPVRYIKYRLSRFHALIEGLANEAVASERPCLATHIGNLAVEAQRDEEIRDQIVTALVAGFEVSVAGLEWLLYWIVGKSGKIDEIREEIAAPDTQHPMISGPLLDSMCKESHRLTPPIDFYPRQLIGGWNGRPLLVAPCSLMMHREEEAFKHAEKFVHDRFVGENISNNKYSLYGGGKWRCPGELYSQAIMKMFVALILRRFDITLDVGQDLSFKRKTIVLLPARLRVHHLKVRL